MHLQIKVSEKGVIEDAKFKTFGCGSAIAASSLANEWLKGRTLEEAEAIQNVQIVEELYLPPVKTHCSVLTEDAIKSAIADFRAKRAKRNQEDERLGVAYSGGGRGRGGEPADLCRGFDAVYCGLGIVAADWNITVVFFQRATQAGASVWTYTFTIDFARAGSSFASSFRGPQGGSGASTGSFDRIASGRS